MAAPVFVRGTTPYWEAACGCRMSVLTFTPCRRHAAGPDLLAALRELVECANAVEVIGANTETQPALVRAINALAVARERADAAIRNAAASES